VDAIIFDVDGTLCDVRSVRHHVRKHPRDFHAFHADSIDCPPNPEVAAAARQAREDGYEVIVVTARENRWMYTTLIWLHENDIPHDRLIMRSANDFRPDREIKQEILAYLLRKGYRIVEAWDDNPSVVGLWEENGIKTHVVPGFFE
jgi:FMN phosphatase YigB (HAD superfamily)